MTASSDKSSVFNSRPIDVHLWSTYIEVDIFIDPLWQNFNSEQTAAAVGSRGRPTTRIKRDGMKVLLLALYVCWREDTTKYLGISANSNDWSRGRYKAIHLSKSILDILRWLVDKGYVDKREHWHSSAKPSQNRTARYRASEKLQNLFKNALFGLDDICTHENKECIVLKGADITDDVDLDAVVSLDYVDTPATIAMREHLNAYNLLLKQSQIDICSLEIPVVRRKIKRGKRRGQFTTVAIGQHNKYIRRIFSRGSWDMHGRFFGGWWQQIGSDIRSHIFINGNPTVEVDFKAIHVSLLNAQTGAAATYDPYKVSSDVFPEVDRSTVRSWSKILVLTAINAKDRKSAYRAFRNNAATGSAEKGLKDLQLAKLLDSFIANNPHLTEFVGSDQGIKLMNKDSHIAADIMGTLTTKNIPVLTVHDSFIVERHYFAELRFAMVEASLKHCRRNLIAEQDGLTVDFSDGLNLQWGVINEQAVNKLPKHPPCQQYLDRFKGFCDAAGVVPVMTNKGRGLMARNVISLR